MKILDRASNTITISTFWENYLLQKYDFDPPYQRRSIWSDEKQSYYIDSIMKNFPTPPIFLRQRIDSQTGKTNYDVIDGKQRLTSIIRFINNEIPIASDFVIEELDVEDLNGAYFKDMDKPELNEYKKNFWMYKLPIEYIDTESGIIIDTLFDRLNRNGEPLRGQELRNAKYHDTPLLDTIVKLSNNEFWLERLEVVDRNRMEDTEFVSELLFVLLEGKLFDSNQKTLDQLYSKYSERERQFDEAKNDFLSVTEYMESLNLDYKALRISGVSHLYGIWCLCKYCMDNDIKKELVRQPLNEFFTGIINNEGSFTDYHKVYKQSMSSRTKSKIQRERRLQSLQGALGFRTEITPVEKEGEEEVEQ